MRRTRPTLKAADLLKITLDTWHKARTHACIVVGVSCWKSHKNNASAHDWISKKVRVCMISRFECVWCLCGLNVDEQRFRFAVIENESATWNMTKVKVNLSAVPAVDTVGAWRLFWVPYWGCINACGHLTIFIKLSCSALPAFYGR